MTRRPSWNSTFVSSPSTRVWTVTVLSGVTEPSPARYTATSDVRAAVATTGTGGVRPSGPEGLEVFDCALPEPTRRT